MRKSSATMLGPGNRVWVHSSNAWTQDSTRSQLLIKTSTTRDDSKLVHVQGCQLLGPLGRVRCLGWFVAMSNEVDESFKQMKEEIHRCLVSPRDHGPQCLEEMYRNTTPRDHSPQDARSSTATR